VGVTFGRCLGYLQSEKIAESGSDESSAADSIG
jgi:hypothetical protein